MSEWAWLPKFLLGVALGYYVMSPRLRHFVNEIVMLLVITIFPKHGKTYRTRFEQERVSEPETPAQAIISTAKVVRKSSGGSALQVSQEELDMWLKNNPDLKVQQ